MKRLIILMAFLLPLLLPGQEQNIWNGTAENELTDELEMAGGDTILYSKSFMPFNVHDGFNGLLGLALDVDNLTGTPGSDADSLTFYLQKNLADNWITGSAIAWNALSESATGQDATFSTTQTLISPQTADSAKTFIYILDPSTITNMNGYPSEEYRIRIDTNDSLYFNIRLDWDQY